MGDDCAALYVETGGAYYGLAFRVTERPRPGEPGSTWPTRGRRNVPPTPPPPVIPPDVWQRTTKGNAAAVAIADRHYSRAKYGKQGGQVGPPGRLLVLITTDGKALWITHWPDPKLALDGLDSWRCVMFRNEGTDLSSSLIVAAMARTAELWPDATPPRDGWVTWVDRAEVRSTNPGYCFMRAGWWADREWVASTKARRTLLRLRADHAE